MLSNIEIDLRNHLTARLRELLADHADTMHRADLDGPSIAAVVIAALLCEAAEGMVQFGYDEEVFLSSCKIAYATAKRTHAPEKRAAKKSG